jgi:hypothetical protein
MVVLGIYHKHATVQGKPAFSSILGHPVYRFKVGS